MYIYYIDIQSHIFSTTTDSNLRVTLHLKPKFSSTAWKLVLLYQQNQQLLICTGWFAFAKRCAQYRRGIADDEYEFDRENDCLMWL